MEDTSDEASDGAAIDNTTGNETSDSTESTADEFNGAAIGPIDE